MGLLDGLADLGLGGLENIDIMEDSSQKNLVKSVNEKGQTTITLKEEDMLFDKTHECVVCGNSFKNRTVRTGKARLIDTDKDLRNIFEGIEPLKYDVISCPYCGFTAVSRYFENLVPSQKKAIKEQICARFRARDEEENVVTYSYEEAIGRYKLALVNSVVKNGKMSERAYVCLRAGWLVRSYIDELDKAEEKDVDKIKEMKALEEEFIQKAYDGYIAAMGKETFPISGMDETTLNYLLATLALRFKHYEVSAKLVATILQSPSCNSRIKDKARDLKDEILQAIRDDKAH